MSCEHGGYRVPARYRKLFSRRLLESHRGHDPGALALARDLAAALGARLFYGTTTRLLIELNRTLDHPQLFSRRALALPVAEREQLIRRHYLPYWNGVEAHVARALERGRRVVHLSSHSFTPRMNGVRRTADVGLLFDPGRRQEAAFCRAWDRALRAAAPRLRVRGNYPYHGTGNGLTTALRARFAGRAYLGLQIEINQRFPRGDARRWRAVRRAVVSSVETVLKAGW